MADPGRLKELLRPGMEMYLTPVSGERRKTEYDVVLVKKGEVLVSLDSRLPNKLFASSFKAGLFKDFACFERINPEVKAGSSRLDFMLESAHQSCYVEVKSVNLVVNGCAYFPDAPTARGSRHLQELRRIVSCGYRAAVVFIIQRVDAEAFAPNEVTDPVFAQNLREAAVHGVEMYAYRCHVDLKNVWIEGVVPIHLQ